MSYPPLASGGTNSLSSAVAIYLPGRAEKA